MWNQKPRFRFEISTFSEKEVRIVSPIFEYGGCEWCLKVWPKGNSRCDDHLSLYLRVANPSLLRTGWKRSVKYYFVVLNQSNKELTRSNVQTNTLFCAESPAWGFRKILPLNQIPENGRLIIEVYINAVEAIDGEGRDVLQQKEGVDINRFQGFASHVTSVKKLFAEHVVKTEYKNVLINACSKLSELAEVGSKVDWLKSKLDEVSLKSKRADDDDGSRFQQLEERIKNLELMESGFKTDSLKSKLDEISLERKKSCDADRSLFKKLEERIKILELMESGLKINYLKSKLDEISLERKKSYDVDGSHVQKLEERIKNLELMESGFKIDCLKSKLEEISLERKKSDDADGSHRVQQHEERIKNLELLMSDLKAELDKEKDKSFADGFLLVDEVN